MQLCFLLCWVLVGLLLWVLLVFAWIVDWALGFVLFCRVLLVVPEGLWILQSPGAKVDARDFPGRSERRPHSLHEKCQLTSGAFWSFLATFKSQKALLVADICIVLNQKQYLEDVENRFFPLDDGCLGPGRAPSPVGGGAEFEVAKWVKTRGLLVRLVKVQFF